MTKAARKLLDFIGNICPRVLNFKFCSSFLNINVSRSLNHLLFFLQFLLLSFSTSRIVLINYFRVHFQFVTTVLLPVSFARINVSFFLLLLTLKFKTLLLCPNIKGITGQCQFHTLLSLVFQCAINSRIQYTEFSTIIRKQKEVGGFVAVTTNSKEFREL